MKSEQLEQRSESWFAQRVGKVTASRVGGILGLSPFATRDNVMRTMVREALGAESEFTGNVATEYGNKHEDDALNALEARTGELIESVGIFTHPDYEWLAASPDGLMGNVVVEVKSPYSKKIKTLEETPHYWAQVQIQMACTGRIDAVFGVWTPDEFHHEYLVFHKSWFDEKLPILKSFHDEYLEIIADEDLSKPYLEDLVNDMEGNSEWETQVLRYVDAKAVMNCAKADLETAKKELIRLANGKKSAGCGVLVYSIKGRTTTNYKQVIADNCEGVDLSAYQKTGAQSWAVK